MNVIYVISLNGIEQPELGTFNTFQGAEDTIYRHVTKLIKSTNEPFHEALRKFTVTKKEV